MPPAQELFAIWLLPEPSARAYFREIIRTLAERFDAPIFEPHLTLCGAINGREQALGLLEKLPTNERFQLRVEGIHCSTRYTQTLFVRLQLGDELRRLRGLIGESAEFDPHISLLYNEMPLAEKEELARSLHLPFTHVTFHRWQLIAHPPQITTRADVESWRKISAG